MNVYTCICIHVNICVYVHILYICICICVKHQFENFEDFAPTVLTLED